MKLSIKDVQSKYNYKSDNVNRVDKPIKNRAKNNSKRAKKRK